MRILVSNDDGYLSPGLAALADAARAFGEVTVVAPDRDRSGASNSLTLDRPLSVGVAGNGFRFLNGTPTDCVHVAITGLLEHRPDLVISGINDGANMGEDTIYSGTVAAAMEGFLLGVPAIAFSLSQRGYAHLETARRVAHELVGRFAAALARGEDARHALGGARLLSVNVPPRPHAELQGWRVTRLGKRHAAEPVHRATNPRGEPIYWIGAAGPARDAGPGTDFHAIAQGYVSITPLDGDLAAYDQMEGVDAWLTS